MRPSTSGTPLLSLPVINSSLGPPATVSKRSIRSNAAVKEMEPGLSAVKRNAITWSGALENASRVKVTPSFF